MNKSLLKALIKEEIQQNITSIELSNSIKKLLPEETSYVDLAKAIGMILEDEYGTHVYEDFIDVLKQNLRY